MSLVAIVLLTAGYELVRAASRKYEFSHDQRMSAFNSGTGRKFSSLTVAKAVMNMAEILQLWRGTRAHISS